MNSLGECFYFGVPVLILPAVTDMINNAQRISELGFGLHLSMASCSENELAYALDRLLNDRELRSKWTRASERIRNERRELEIADRIADYVQKL